MRSSAQKAAGPIEGLNDRLLKYRRAVATEAGPADQSAHVQVAQLGSSAPRTADVAGASSGGSRREHAAGVNSIPQVGDGAPWDEVPAASSGGQRGLCSPTLAIASSLPSVDASVGCVGGINGKRTPGHACNGGRTVGDTGCEGVSPPVSGACQVTKPRRASGQAQPAALESNVLIPDPGARIIGRARRLPRIAQTSAVCPC